MLELVRYIHPNPLRAKAQWVVRETVHERIYAGRAAKMVVRAALKRLPIIGMRFTK